MKIHVLRAQHTPFDRLPTCQTGSSPTNSLLEACLGFLSDKIRWRFQSKKKKNKKTRKQKNNPKLLSHSSRLNYSIVSLGGFHSSCPNVKCRRHSLVDADDVVDRSPNLDKSSHPLQWSHQPAATKQNPKGREKNKLTQNDSMLKWPTLKRQKGSPLKRRGFGVESLETPDLPAGRNGNSSNGLGWAPIWMASQEASDHKGSYLTSTDIGPARVHGEKIQGQGY